MVTINPRPETNARVARADAEAKLLTIKATREGVKTLLQTGGRAEQSTRPHAIQSPPRPVVVPAGSMPRVGGSHIAASEAARAYASTAATSSDDRPIGAAKMDEVSPAATRLPEGSMPARPLTQTTLPMASAAITLPSLRANGDETTDAADPVLTRRFHPTATSGAGSAPGPATPLLRPIAALGMLLIVVIVLASALS